MQRRSGIYFNGVPPVVTRKHEQSGNINALTIQTARLYLKGVIDKTVQDITDAEKVHQVFNSIKLAIKYAQEAINNNKYFNTTLEISSINDASGSGFYDYDTHVFQDFIKGWKFQCLQTICFRSEPLSNSSKLELFGRTIYSKAADEYIEELYTQEEIITQKLRLISNTNHGAGVKPLLLEKKEDSSFVNATANSIMIDGGIIDGGIKRYDNPLVYKQWYTDNNNQTFKCLILFNGELITNIYNATSKKSGNQLPPVMKGKCGSVRCSRTTDKIFLGGKPLNKYENDKGRYDYKDINEQHKLFMFCRENDLNSLKVSVLTEPAKSYMCSGGTSLDKCSQEVRQSIPPTAWHKVLYHLNIFWDKGKYFHGDLKISNMTYDGKQINIVDFDPKKSFTPLFLPVGKVKVALKDSDMKIFDKFALLWAIISCYSTYTETINFYLGLVRPVKNLETRSYIVNALKRVFRDDCILEIIKFLEEFDQFDFNSGKQIPDIDLTTMLRSK